MVGIEALSGPQHEEDSGQSLPPAEDQHRDGGDRSGRGPLCRGPQPAGGRFQTVVHWSRAGRRCGDRAEAPGSGRGIPPARERRLGHGSLRAPGRVASQHGCRGPAQNRAHRFRTLRQDQPGSHGIHRARQLSARPGGRIGAVGDVAGRGRAGPRAPHVSQGFGVSRCTAAGQGQRAGQDQAGGPAGPAKRDRHQPSGGQRSGGTVPPRQCRCWI